MKRHLMLVAAMATLSVAAGCASKANYSGNIQDEAPVEEAQATQGGAAQAAEPSFDDLPNEVAGPSGGLLDQRLIRFDYDKSVVAEEFLAVIAAHSDYLNQNPRQRVILEGHADERGSNEYNLALGQRRADAVRDLMLANGVRPGQMETLSFGEENPRDSAQNEAAWAQNRRVEIRYYDE